MRGECSADPRNGRANRQQVPDCLAHLAHFSPGQRQRTLKENDGHCQRDDRKEKVLELLLRMEQPQDRTSQKTRCEQGQDCRHLDAPRNPLAGDSRRHDSRNNQHLVVLHQQPLSIRDRRTRPRAWVGLFESAASRSVEPIDPPQSQRMHSHIEHVCSVPAMNAGSKTPPPKSQCATCDPRTAICTQRPARVCANRSRCTHCCRFRPPVITRPRRAIHCRITEGERGICYHDGTEWRAPKAETRAGNRIPKWSIGGDRCYINNPSRSK